MHLLLTGLFDPAKNDACKIHFVEVARSLYRLGHKIELLLPIGSAKNADLGLPNDIRIHWIDIPYSDNPGDVVRASMAQLAALKRLAHRGFDAVYVRWRLFPALFKRLALRDGGLRVPIISEHNGWVELEVQVQRKSKALSLIAKSLQIWDARTAHAVIAVTDGIRDRIRQHARGAQVHTVDNGTNIVQFRPLGSVNNHSGRQFVFGFSGNISRWQGVDSILEAFANIHADFRDARLTIAGSGMYLNEAQAYARKLGLGEAVTFTGDVPYVEMNELMNRFDVALAPKSPALGATGYAPLKIRDYAAAGVPVCASRVPGIAELEQHEWLRCFEPGDSADLERVMRSFILDRARTSALRTAARAYAEAHFSWDVLAGRIAEIIAGAIAETAREHAGERA